MKVLILNGSPRTGGNTSMALDEMVRIFEEQGVETEVIRVGNKAIRGCIACNACAENGKCVFDDIVNEIAPKFEEADGLVVASPVYYASANATLVAFLDRLFYSTGFDKTMKVGASVVVARRGGEAAHDLEGMQTVRVLARNMSFLMKSIALGKEKFGLPETEEWQATNFIS